MTHDQLCDIAVRWLLRPLSGKGAGCQVAFKEVADTMGAERCDAWGASWAWGGRSVLVEVKVSRADFLADAKKPHRIRPETGVGEYRYYMSPEGIIQPADLPPNWGLIWVNKRGHVKVIAGHLLPLIASNYGGIPEAETWLFRDFNHARERNILAYMFRRVGDADALLQRQRADQREILQLKTQLGTAKNELNDLRRKYNRSQGYVLQGLLNSENDHS